MLLWIVSGMSLLMSLLAKFLVDRFLDTRFAVLGDFAGIVRTENPGIAFGITMPPLIQIFAIGSALILVVFIAIRSAKTPLQQIGFGLIIGGALGNIIDRIRDGVVTDFFQVGTFPVFNVADSCITIGVILLLVSTLERHKL